MEGHAAGGGALGAASVHLQNLSPRSVWTPYHVLHSTPLLSMFLLNNTSTIINNKIHYTPRNPNAQIVFRTL